jgi:alanine dehydrogenase
MSPMTLGVLTSHKENEKRMPIHPRHFDQIPASLRKSILFEKGCGAPLDLDDAELEDAFGGVRSRGAVLADADIILLPKPLAEDLRQMRHGTVLWGWPHCVQQTEITQAAIDRRLTLIAWEAMFLWRDGVRDMHLFYRNNEMAGYCGVQHALDLVGTDGLYGEKLKAVVLSLGSVSRGAIYALQGRGVFDIDVYTQRPPFATHDQVAGCRYGQMIPDENGRNIVVVDEDGVRRELRHVLAEADLIVNGILQDTDRPLMYVEEDDVPNLKPRSLIIDVSCDERMGFPFARPTTFEEPVFRVGAVQYYAVDHTPSYLWRSASWEISRVVIAFLETVMGGPEAWGQDESIHRAVEIYDGVIQNERILSFQGRESTYPHAVRG